MLGITIFEGTIIKNGIIVRESETLPSVDDIKILKMIKWWLNHSNLQIETLIKKPQHSHLNLSFGGLQFRDV